MFKKSQDYLVRLDWDDNVIFPQQAAQNNLHALNEQWDFWKKVRSRLHWNLFTVLIITAMRSSLREMFFTILQNIS